VYIRKSVENWEEKSRIRENGEKLFEVGQNPPVRKFVSESGEKAHGYKYVTRDRVF